MTSQNVEDTALAWSRCSPTGAEEPRQSLHFFIDEDSYRRDQERERGALVYPDIESCLSDVAPVITREAIENAPPSLFLIHAAAVADIETGRVIGLIGPSGAGKTTAVRVLSSSFGYVTDETLAVSLEGLSVTPYPKPLSVIKKEASRLKNQLGPDQLGLQLAPPRLQLSALFMLDRNPDHDGPPELTDIPLLDALALLVPQVSYLARREKPIHDLLSALSIGAGLRRLTYGEATDLPEYISQIFSEDGRQVNPPADSAQLRARQEAPVRQPNLGGEEAFGVKAPMRFMVRAESVGDEVSIDGLQILMVRGDVVVLQGLGTDIRQLSQAGISFDRLVDELVARYGEPADGDADQLALEFVRNLVDQGVVTIDPQSGSMFEI